MSEVEVMHRPASVVGLDRLAAWNLERVAHRAQRENEWSESHTAAVMEEYRRFLALSVLEPEIVYGMAGDVDLAWHAHLADERDYARMCEHVIGHFLQHEPGLVFPNGERATSYYAQNTYPRLARYFGSPTAIWPDPETPGLAAKCCSGHIEIPVPLG